ncbi:helix-turn-helix domain containing protein [Cupriavidus basilensis]|uniref:Helix-turn-helix domain containing protein n=1 Tax=Cupriavidus basilensis TaxID=68895 RepID=A0ABT6ALV1_9BURK|nr:helix-turn-helix domain-containing protein [Cupriavidus basilensis]MDF3833584.1 helix-turn-helix domain containing protein [Cupriavidus basilensis]
MTTSSSAAPSAKPSKGTSAFPTVSTPSILQPPRQRRARETEQALLDAGRELLAQRDFSAVSVAQIASACEVSVGAFYGRFRDKQAFFESLRALVMQETGESVARYLRKERWEEVPTDVMLEKTMRFVVLGCHANRGVIKASLKHASIRPEEWLPHRESGQAVVERMVALLVPRLPLPPEQAELRVRFAMQAVFSIVVNAILNDAGPLPLDDERLPGEMTRLVAGYLALPA